RLHLPAFAPGATFPGNLVVAVNEASDHRGIYVRFFRHCILQCVRNINCRTIDPIPGRSTSCVPGWTGVSSTTGENFGAVTAKPPATSTPERRRSRPPPHLAL